MIKCNTTAILHITQNERTLACVCFSSKFLLDKPYAVLGCKVI